MPAINDESDEQVFHRLRALGSERFKQRSIEEAARKFAGAPAHYMEQFKRVAGAFDQIGRQLSASLGHDPDKVDLVSIARLRNDGFLTEAEVAAFSPEAREEIKRHMNEPMPRPPF